MKLQLIIDIKSFDIAKFIIDDLANVHDANLEGFVIIKEKGEA